MGERLNYRLFQKQGITEEKKGRFSNFREDRSKQSLQYYMPVRQQEERGLKYNGAIKEMHENLIADAYNDISPEVLDEVSRSEFSKMSLEAHVPLENCNFLKDQKEVWGDILRRTVKYQDDMKPENHGRIPLNNDIHAEEAIRKTSGKSLKSTKHKEKSSYNLQHHVNPINKNLNREKIINEILNLIGDAHLMRAASENRVSKCEKSTCSKRMRKGESKEGKNSDSDKKEMIDSNNGSDNRNVSETIDESEPKANQTRSSDSPESQTIVPEDDIRTVVRGSDPRHTDNNSTRQNKDEESDETSDSSTPTETTVRHVLPEIHGSAKDLHDSLRTLPKMNSKELVYAWLNAHVRQDSRNICHSSKTYKVTEVPSRDAEQEPPSIPSKRDYAALTKFERIGELERIYGKTSCFDLYCLPRPNTHLPGKELKEGSPVSLLS